MDRVQGDGHLVLPGAHLCADVGADLLAGRPLGVGLGGEGGLGRDPGGAAGGGEEERKPQEPRRDQRQDRVAHGRQVGGRDRGGLVGLHGGLQKRRDARGQGLEGACHRASLRAGSEGDAGRRGAPDRGDSTTRGGRGQPSRERTRRATSTRAATIAPPAAPSGRDDRAAPGLAPRRGTGRPDRCPRTGTPPCSRKAVPRALRPARAWRDPPSARRLRERGRLQRRACRPCRHDRPGDPRSGGAVGRLRDAQYPDYSDRLLGQQQPPQLGDIRREAAAPVRRFNELLLQRECPACGIQGESVPSVVPPGASPYALACDCIKNDAVEGQAVGFVGKGVHPPRPVVRNEPSGRSNQREVKSATRTESALGMIAAVQASSQDVLRTNARRPTSRTYPCPPAITRRGSSPCLNSCTEE